MSESNVSPMEGIRQRIEERLEAESSSSEPEAVPETESDLDETPELSAESEVSEDGALAADETEVDEEDLDETPESEAEGDTVWEKRYKDTQAEYTKVSEELSRFRAEESQVFADMTGARYELEDKLTQGEQMAQYWANKAMAEVQQARQVNFANVPPDQIAQAQQWVQQTEAKFQQTQQELQRTMEAAKQAREDALAREAKISRARLTREIRDFDTVYPEIGKFAVDQGVNPAVFRDIVDPGLIRIINMAREMAGTPDAIETVTKKPKAKTHKVKNAPQLQRDEAGRFKKAEEAMRTARTPQERQKAFFEKKQMQLDREYRNR